MSFTTGPKYSASVTATEADIGDGQTADIITVYRDGVEADTVYAAPASDHAEHTAAIREAGYLEFTWGR